jgi:hypothetical protein
VLLAFLLILDRWGLNTIAKVFFEFRSDCIAVEAILRAVFD